MPTGRRSHIGIARETTFGTPVAASDYFRFHNEDLFQEIEQIVPPNILGVPWRGPTYQGANTYQGPIQFDTHPNILGFFFLGALGAVTTANPDPAVRWQHTFAARTTQFADVCWLQPLTFEIMKDVGNAFQFAGTVVNEFGLEFGVDNKVLTANAGVIAKTVARITPTAPTHEATQAFRWNQAAITLPHPTAFATMQRLNFRINNQQQPLHFIDGSRDPARLRGGDESSIITVSGRVLAADAEVTEYTGGTERPLRCIFTGATLGTGNFRLELRFPLFRYTNYRVSIASPGEVFVDFEGEAKYAAGTSDSPMSAIIDNSKSAY